MEVRTSLIIIILLQLNSSVVMYAQSPANKVSEDLCAFFDPVYGPDSRLIQGKVYNNTLNVSTKGNPYYIDSKWKDGSVMINGVNFDQIRIKFDIERNCVVTSFNNIYNEGYQLALENNNIEAFEISYHRFIPLPDSGNIQNPVFCEIIKDGLISYYIKKIKNLEMSNGSGNSTYIYRTSTRHYIYYNSTLYNLRSKRDLLKVFPQYKKEINKYCRINNISFAKKITNGRTKVLTFCENLINSEE